MKVGFIGGGNMAEALIGGMLKQGFAATDISVTEPDPQRRALLVERYAVQTEATAALTMAVDVLVLAVKPQILRAALYALPRPAATTCVLSIAAGVRVGDIARWLGDHAAVVRAMPNTPALVGEGIAGLFALAGVTTRQRQEAEAVLKAVGQVVWVDNEQQIDAVTAISGSGPAYVFYFIEAMETAARDLGLAPATARALSLQTVYGAAALARQDGGEPAVLRARVTSKGGTTERGVAVLEQAQVAAAVVQAARAAAGRARELGDLLGAE